MPRFDILYLLTCITTTMLLACSPSAPEEKPGQKTRHQQAEKSADPAIYDTSRSALFSLDGSCSSPEILLSAPEFFIEREGQKCAITTMGSYTPNWIFQGSGICIIDDKVEKLDKWKAELTHFNGNEYSLQFNSGETLSPLYLCDNAVEDIQPMWGASLEPDYDTGSNFEQTYYTYCEPNGGGCYGSERVKQKYSDYSSDVASPFGLTTDIDRFQVKQYLNASYSGRVIETKFANKNHPDHVMTFHLIPEGQEGLNEYVLYVRAEGDSGFDKIKDWGARVKCAPAHPDKKFQKTACP